MQDENAMSLVKSISRTGEAAWWELAYWEMMRLVLVGWPFVGSPQRALIQSFGFKKLVAL